MRSFGSVARLTIVALVAMMSLAGGLAAQDAPAASLFSDARTLEAALRKEIAALKPGAASMPLLRRARILVGTYEDIARLFPESGYGDKALSQGLNLSADVYD